MKVRWTLALLITALATGTYAGNVLATPSSGVMTTILGKQPATFDPFEINAHTIPADQWKAQLRTHETSDVYVVDNKFAPGRPPAGTPTPAPA